MRHSQHAVANKEVALMRATPVLILPALVIPSFPRTEKLGMLSDG